MRTMNKDIQPDTRRGKLLSESSFSKSGCRKKLSRKNASESHFRKASFGKPSVASLPPPSKAPFESQLCSIHSPKAVSGQSLPANYSPTNEVAVSFIFIFIVRFFPLFIFS